MKIIKAPVEVDVKKGWPVAVHWKKRRMVVRQIADWWVARERWWSREEERVYFRLITDRGTLEVYRCGDRWTLARMFD